MRKIVLFCVFSILLALPALAQDVQESFHKANEFYRAGDYAKAEKIYSNLIELNPNVASFYYDLANTQVRLGKLSSAILNYEKTLLLAPRNKDARDNLKYARGLLEYSVEDTRNWYVRTGEAVLKFATKKEILTAELLALFVFFINGMLFFLTRRNAFWSSWQKVWLVVLLLVSIVVLAKYLQSDRLREAVVVQKECDARFGPSVRDSAAFKMGEGIKVFVVDRREDWSRVLLTNGESGWVNDNDIAEVVL